MIKAYVYGDSGVGKSSLVKSFVHGRFDPYNESVVGLDFQSVNVNFDGMQVLTELWMGDVAFYHCAVVVYDITKKSSFLSAVLFLNRLKNKSTTLPPILVAANKADLVNEREVSQTEGEMLALKFSALYAEVTSYEPAEVRKELGEFIADVYSSSLDPVSILDEYMDME